METLQRTANRGSISTGAYEIDNSCKFEADNSERLKSNNTHASSTPTSSKIGTFSFWVKRTELGANYMIVSGNSARYSRMFFNSSDQIQLYSGDSSWNSVQPITNAVFRDTSAWYHIVLRLDSTDSTAANRLRLYVNGEEQTWSTSPNITQDGVLTLCQFGSPTWHSWGSNLSYFSPSAYFSGYLAEVHYVDGQALAPTEFGETDSDSGIWKPKEYDGTYGNSGYYMDFEDASNLGDDESGNGFDFDENNITSADQATDTPTNNFCTWVSDGTLFNIGTDNETFSEGGTRFNTRSGTGWTAVYPTQSFAGGKWYMEVKVNETSATNMYGAMPVRRINSLKYQEYHHGQDVDGSIGIYANNGQIYWGTAGSGGSGGALSAGNIVGLAIDMENYKMYFAVNNTYVESGDPAGNSNGRDIEQEPYVFSIAHYTTTTVEDTNFGGYTAISNTHTNTDENGYGSFVYAPPSGFLAVCTKNLGENGG